MNKFYKLTLLSEPQGTNRDGGESRSIRQELHFKSEVAMFDRLNEEFLCGEYPEMRITILYVED